MEESEALEEAEKLVAETKVQSRAAQKALREKRKAAGLRPVKPKKQKQQQIAKCHDAPEDEIIAVFDFWAIAVRHGQKTLVLDYERRMLIGWAIHDYGLEKCLDAVRGILKSEWHMGQNPSGKKYNDVTLIFRNAANVEKFAALGAQKSAREAFRDGDERPRFSRERADGGGNDSKQHCLHS